MDILNAANSATVYSPTTGRTLPEFTVEVAHIAALETDESANPVSQMSAIPIPIASTAATATIPIRVAPIGPRNMAIPISNLENTASQQPQHSTRRKSSNFEDPAILSMGKRPSIPLATKSSPNIVSPKRDYAKPVRDHESPKSTPKVYGSVQRDTQQQQEKQQHERSRSRRPSAAANLIDPASFSRYIGDFKPKGDHTTRERNAQNLPNFSSSTKDPQGNPVLAGKVKKPRKRRNPKPRDENADIVGQGNNSHGWRQTPLLEPTKSFQPFATLKKQGKAQKNGWGTEDASDVQEMGDFDFEGNLLKFDKTTVFGQIKAEDNTADEERLVSHNRKPKPGTAGGKNLHYSENVLESTPTFLSEAGDSDEEVISHKGSGSGRTSRIAGSKSLLNRRSTSRKASSITSSLPNSRPQSSKSSFYLVNANRKCEVISALQALNLENIANNELGLTEDMMSENAGRGIAEVGLRALSSGNRRLTLDDTAMPIVVVFAGNNKSGQRAVCAGRHLRNHGVHVIVCVLGLEREPELLEDLRRQLKVFRSFGGKVFRKVDMIEHLSSLETSVELIIDGLLGTTMTIEELRIGDQATAFELITWANRSKANVLAIDIPSGIDPTSGKIAIIEGSPLYLNARYVVSMSAPKKGLLQAMIAGEGQAWQLFVVDVGIGDAAWKKAGTRMRRGVEFDQDWVVGLRFQLA